MKRLTTILSKLLSDTLVPDVFKITNVTPIFKNKKTLHPANYIYSLASLF